MNRPCFLIPVYNHGSTLGAVVSSLAPLNVPIIVVDDGNVPEQRQFIVDVEKSCPLVKALYREKNGGKGRAVNDGIRLAKSLGYTHAFQLDADGQHDVSRCKFFLEQSELNPRAVISSYPEYDESVPKARLRARKFANLWIHIVTLSTQIKDALLGFRIYPVDDYFLLLKKHAAIDSHMGFDAEILVRLSWLGLEILSYPVGVSYPKDGVSNFRVVRDNAHISLAYTRLFFGMILRLPALLFRSTRRRFPMGRDK